MATSEDKGKVALLIERLRARHHWLDHVLTANERYTEQRGNYFAAAITYFSFLAIVPLLLVLVAVLGLIVKYDPTIFAQLTEAIHKNVPGDLATGILLPALNTARRNASTIGIISLLIFVYSGLGWVTNLRTAVQQMWDQPATKRSFIKEQIGDLLTLIGLGLTLVVSIGLSAIVGSLTGEIVKLLHLDSLPGASYLTGALAVVVSLVADVVLFLYLIVVLPRRKVALRSVLRGAILGAVGFEIIKIVVTIYLTRITTSAAYGIFGGILGLFFAINLLARLLLLVVCWTATTTAQQEIDAPEPVVAPVFVRTAAVDSPSPRVIIGALVAFGAVLGLLLPGFVRRWWSGESS